MLVNSLHYLNNRSTIIVNIRLLYRFSSFIAFCFSYCVFAIVFLTVNFKFVPLCYVWFFFA